jgi:pSer/pThr/pTyr-binding forkhead associated (FHA) protein
MEDMHDTHTDGTNSGRWPEDFAPLRLRKLPGQETLVLERPQVLVGRHSDADVRLAYHDISRRHCRFVFVDGQWRVQDLDSLNGTYLNNVRTTEATLLDGDRLRLGPVVFVVEGSAVERTRRVLRQIALTMTPETRARVR